MLKELLASMEKGAGTNIDVPLLFLKDKVQQKSILR